MGLGYFARRACKSRDSIVIQISQTAELMDSLQDALKDSGLDHTESFDHVQNGLTLRCPRCGKTLTKWISFLYVVNSLRRDSDVFLDPNYGSLGRGVCPGCGGNTVEATYDPQPPRKVSVTFRPRVAQGSDEVYIAGSFNNWDPRGICLEQSQQADVRTITLDFLEGQVVEYKYTRGSWQTVETTINQADRLNRRLKVQYGTSGSMQIDDVVEGWKDSLPK